MTLKVSGLVHVIYENRLNELGKRSDLKAFYLLLWEHNREARSKQNKFILLRVCQRCPLGAFIIMYYE